MGNVSALKIVESPEAMTLAAFDLAMALAEFDVTEAALAEIKQYEALEIQDSKSESQVRKCRQVVRTMRTDIDKRRKELKAPLLAHGKLIDQTAKELTARLLPTETCLDEKIKAVEAIAETARAEKMAAEKIRTDAILAEITAMENITSAAQVYGLSAGDVFEHLTRLEQFSVEKDFFEEFFDNTISAKEKQLEIVRACYERTLKWEADQKAQAQVEAANKAESDRLAQIALLQERSAKEEAGRLATEKASIKAEKASIEAEIARLAAEKIVSERRAIEVEWLGVAMSMDAAWMNSAYRINDQIDMERLILRDLEHSQAIDLNDQIDLGQTMADDITKARLEALVPDKAKLIEFANSINLFTAEMKTDQGRTMAFWINSQIDELKAELISGIETI